MSIMILVRPMTATPMRGASRYRHGYGQDPPDFNWLGRAAPEKEKGRNQAGLPDFGLSGDRLTRSRGIGGAEEDRTPDLRIANATLSQLSYRPGVAVYESACAGPCGARMIAGCAGGAKRSKHGGARPAGRALLRCSAIPATVRAIFSSPPAES
jgi:hypothetical protein